MKLPHDPESPESPEKHHQHPNIGDERPKRRRFTNAYRMRILEEADLCTKRGELGLLLRREGIYSSHIASWRRWRRRVHPEHPQSKKPPTESQSRHELVRLQRENIRLQLKLEHAEKLNALQKKLADMMEAIEPADSSEGSSA